MVESKVTTLKVKSLVAEYDTIPNVGITNDKITYIFPFVKEY